MRALSPNTEAKYRKALERAWPEVAGRHVGDFGDYSRQLPQKPPKVDGMPESSRVILRSAILRAFEHDEDRGRQLVRMVPPAYRVKKQPRYPTLDEVSAFEKCLQKSKKVPERTVLLLALKLGLRSTEALNVRREDVARALETDELLVTTKGGKEHVLPSEGVRGLLETALELSARGSRRGDDAKRRKEAWSVLGETVSCGSYKTQHNLISRLVKSCAASAGLDLKRWSPHKLRHGFASRLSKKGASIQVIQTALGHANIQTTQRYVHVEREQLRELMK